MRTPDENGQIGGMMMQASDDDKIAIFGSSAYALQIRHPDGRYVLRLGWDGEFTIDDEFAEIKP